MALIFIFPIENASHPQFSPRNKMHARTFGPSQRVSTVGPTTNVGQAARSSPRWQQLTQKLCNENGALKQRQHVQPKKKSPSPGRTQPACQQPLLSCRDLSAPAHTSSPRVFRRAEMVPRWTAAAFAAVLAQALAPGSHGACPRLRKLRPRWAHFGCALPPWGQQWGLVVEEELERRRNGCEGWRADAA